MRLVRNAGLAIASFAAVAFGFVATSTSANAAELDAAGPEVVALSTNAPEGSIMPNFTQRALTDQAGQYSVSIDSIPASVAVGQPFVITGHTSGFAPGNWINVWVRTPDGTQFDDGGLIASDGTFTLPATLVYPGQSQVQVSAGAWPAEQWSAPVSVTVAGGLSTAAQGVVYHDLAGRPIVVAAAAQLPGFRGATYSFCPAAGGMCVHQTAAPAGENAYVGVYPVPVGGFLDDAAPNSTTFMKAITYQNL